MNYKEKIVDGQKVYYSADWINDLERELHFKWYYNQAKMVYDKCERDRLILEIGIGTGLLSDLLRKRGWKIKTLDIDEDKNPDYCESASEFDYIGGEIDVVLAFEIFEHIPFLTFEKVIAKLGQSNVKEIYFSLPWNERRLFDVRIKIPKFEKFSWSFSLPAGRINTHAHFWELSNKFKAFGEKQLIDIARVSSVFKACGYNLKNENKIGNIQYFSAVRNLAA